MGDHNDRQPQLGTQVAEQAQNLHLHGDVQRGRRFVGNQQPRFRRKGDGDHRPLAHTAGKFVRIAIEPIPRVRDADLTQQGQRIFPRLTAVCRKMEAPAFRDLLPNGHHRIEMAGRVLENHTDFPPAHRRHLPFAEGQDIPAVEHNLTAANPQSVPRQQAHQRPAGHGFSRPAFANQPQHLPGFKRE